MRGPCCRVPAHGTDNLRWYGSWWYLLTFTSCRLAGSRRLLKKMSSLSWRSLCSSAYCCLRINLHHRTAPFWGARPIIITSHYAFVTGSSFLCIINSI
jgi:hypothetical protein